MTLHFFSLLSVQNQLLIKLIDFSLLATVSVYNYEQGGEEYSTTGRLYLEFGTGALRLTSKTKKEKERFLSGASSIFCLGLSNVSPYSSHLPQPLYNVSPPQLGHFASQGISLQWNLF